MNNNIEERARRLLGETRGRIRTAETAPRPGYLRILAHCSSLCLPFVIIGEADGDSLRILRNESLLPNGRDSGGGRSLKSLGSFGRLDGWMGCPHCRALENPAHGLSQFWICGSCGGLNCSGCDQRGRFHCSCGLTTMGPFHPIERVEVRGSAAPPPPLSPPPRALVAPAPTGPHPAAGSRLDASGPPPLLLTGRRR